MTVDKWMPRLLAFLVGLISALLLFFGLVTIHNTTYTCNQLNLLKSQVSEQIKNGSKRLPTIQYYREHPKELAIAKANNRELLKALSPSQCGGIFR